MATPGFTLTATLQTIAGGAAGSASNPAKLLIVLCGAGLAFPSVTGTSTLAQRKYEVLFTGTSAVTQLLYGNDQISPAGTWYSITVSDGRGNILQTGDYLLTGSAGNLSDLIPFNSLYPAAIGVYVVPITNCSQVVFDGKKGTGQSLTLTTDVTSSTAQNFTVGAVVPFFIKQDATGGRAFAWPANFIGPPPINLNPNGVTTSMWYLGADGNYHLYRESLYIDPAGASTVRVQPFAAVAPVGIDLGGFSALQVLAATCILDALKGRTQSLLLTEDVTISGANNFTTGNLITLAILQDPVGAWALTWGSEFQQPPMINATAFGLTTVLWADDEFGNYYQFGAAIWS